VTQLDNKTAVITGASSGIGKAIAITYAKAGASVIVNYNHSHDDAGKIVNYIQSLGGKALAIQADVSDGKHVERLLSHSQKELGLIDIWVNNAGANILTGDGAKLDDENKLEQLINVDLKGTMKCCWAIAPVMQQQGHGLIINMSWDLALHGFAGRNPQMFATVKAGVIGFSKAIAKSYGPEVRVNVLAPGWIETGFAREGMPDDYYQARINEIPLNRFGTPEDVAQTALFLASDGASYMTGEVININGGLI